MSATCTHCGFPMDTPERAHAFIHQQGEALIEHRKARATEAQFVRDAARGVNIVNADYLDIEEAADALATLARSYREDYEEIAAAFKSVMAGKPVRNADELIARAGPCHAVWHDDGVSAIPPGPVRDLGARLASMLDEDKWASIEPYLRACLSQVSGNAEPKSLLRPAATPPPHDPTRPLTVNKPRADRENPEEFGQ